MALAGALAAGCSSSGSVGKTVGGWFGSDTKTAATKKTTKILYVKTDGLGVHVEAKESSKAVGSLSAGEKVSRGKVSGTWAYVEARGGRVKGWVSAAQLGSRPAAVAGTPGQPGATTATGEEAPGGEADAMSGEAEAASEETSDETSEEEVTAEEATGETPEAAAVPAPAPVEEPAGPKPAPAKKGKVAPSVFDPY